MKILIIDNFDSFVYNIVQYVGELGVKPLVYRVNELTLKKAQSLKPDRIIISPGPGNPENPRYAQIFTSIFRTLSVRTATLGICLGHQAIASVFGGKIVSAKNLLHGKVSEVAHDGRSIFSNVKNPLKATRYHSLTVDAETLPATIKVTARSLEDGEVMGIRHLEYPIEGIQFHPESILTEDGKKIIKNFIDEGVKLD
ncbi:MAG: anthranilate synthase component II [Candidatus Odinarchaeia archaeon]